MLKFVIEDADFILSENITWQSILYGYKKNWIDGEIPIAQAIKLMQEGENYHEEVVILAGFSSSDNYEIEEYLAKLSAKENFLPKDLLKIQWIYLIIKHKWLAVKEKEFALIMEEMNNIFEYFNYPEDIETFADWQRNRTKVETTEENILKSIEEYLKKMNLFFSKISSI